VLPLSIFGLLLIAVMLWNPANHLIFSMRLALAMKALASDATGQELAVRQEKVQRKTQTQDYEALIYYPEKLAFRHGIGNVDNAERNAQTGRTIENYEWVFDKLDAFSEWFPDSGARCNEFLSSLRNLNDESLLRVYKQLRAIGRYCKKTYGWLDVTENMLKPVVKKKKRVVKKNYLFN
jgi:hypothetical protein